MVLNRLNQNLYLLIAITSLVFLNAGWGCQSTIRVGTKSVENASEDSLATLVLVNKDSVIMAIAKSPKSEFVREARIGGTVIINILVNENANYIEHEVVKSPHPAATRAVEEYIPFMRFAFAEKTPNSSPMNIYEFRFKYTSL
jgi:hypothetical protein